MISPLNSSSELNFSKKRKRKKNGFTKLTVEVHVILIQGRIFVNYKYIWPEHPTFWRDDTYLVLDQHADLDVYSMEFTKTTVHMYSFGYSLTHYLNFTQAVSDLEPACLWSCLIMKGE